MSHTVLGTVLGGVVGYLLRAAIAGVSQPAAFDILEGLINKKSALHQFSSIIFN